MFERQTDPAVSAPEGWACFDTELGVCGVAWGPAGIRGMQLPEGDAQATARRMQRRFPALHCAQPDAQALCAIAGVQALLRGEVPDFSAVTLDMTGVPAFAQRVYVLAMALAPGQTITYGELARRAGEPGAARAVGQAMGHNRFAPIMPCHRVLAADGRIGGFSAPGGAATKQRMLAIEGALAQRRLF